MPRRPDLLENLSDETTHAAALAVLLSLYPDRHPLAIATGFVNLGGLHELADAITDDRPVRLLIGAAPAPGLGEDLPLTLFERARLLLSQERDLARFPPSRAAARLARVHDWLGRPSVQVRRYVTRFLHGKAYLFGDADDACVALVTSANLTSKGLRENLELGLIHYNPSPAHRAMNWFDKLWDQAEDYKDRLADLLFPDPGLIDPQTIYLRALLELYGEELEEPEPPRRASLVALAPFQRDGYDRARRILAAHQGVVYADGVGTGKTEIGLAFIEEYAMGRGQHALVVAPAQLRDIWEQRIHQARLPAQVVTFQQLAADEQLAPDAPSRRRHLHIDRDSYRLVVVDEAHAFRNPDTTWYRTMTRLLGGQRKDVVLLTATPVNNGLWDLYHLVMLFARHDRALAARGIPSIREVFRQAGANERDPANLDPDVLFPVADAVSVRRDRRFIESHYPSATFPDGTPVRFPVAELRTVRYDVDSADPELVAMITHSIGGLTMARYRPSAYEIGGAEEQRERALVGLLQSGILKRFESCWAACLKTVSRMIAAHDAFLAAWDRGAVLSADALVQAARAELDDAGVAGWVADALVEAADHRPITDYRPEFRDAVAIDRGRLVAIHERLAVLDPDSDPKFAALRDLLEQMPARKIAVFATFGDTIAYLDEHLPTPIGGRERVVVIGRDTDPDMRTEALARFSPQTVVRSGYAPPDGEVDLLLATDVLSEGQNLQQAAAVISYDMPWNPQRVVQRNGRVIRLKSPHDRVFLVTMLPTPGDLDEILQLEGTLRRKILAASVYGMESDVLEGVESALRSYAQRLVSGDATLLDETDTQPEGGFVGEELRAQLLRAMSEGEITRLRALPWGVGAAFRQDGAASPGPPGVFFACRTTGGQRYWRFVEADGTLVEAEATILRRINPGSAPRVNLEPGGVDLERLWAVAAPSIVVEHNARADPRADQAQIGPAQRAALDVLRDPAVALPVGAADAEEALTVGRGPLVRQALAKVSRDLAEGTVSRGLAARRIVEIVQEFGLQGVPPGPALEPVTEDDIGVVCWLAVLPPR